MPETGDRRVTPPGRKKPPSARTTLKAAAELDARRQAQIANQIASINRLLEGGRTYDDEMARLHQELAETQVQLEQALSEIKSNQARRRGGA